jgi:hypothetical protein
MQATFPLTFWTLPSPQFYGPNITLATATSSNATSRYSAASLGQL